MAAVAVVVGVAVVALAVEGVYTVGFLVLIALSLVRCCCQCLLCIYFHFVACL